MQDAPHLGRQDAPPLGILRNACARCRPRDHGPSLSLKMCLSLKLRLHLQLKLRPEQPICLSRYDLSEKAFPKETEEELSARPERGFERHETPGSTPDAKVCGVGKGQGSRDDLREST